VSARNSLKHGLLSREVLLPDEDPQAFVELAKRLGEALAPDGELELVLTDRIIGLFWRLRRLSKIEAGVFAWDRAGIMKRRAETKSERAEQKAREDPITSERWEPYRSEQYQLEEARQTDLATGGEIFLHPYVSDALSKLSRYESSLERSLYRALYELQ
jgi:hypothetical protein